MILFSIYFDNVQSAFVLTYENQEFRAMQEVSLLYTLMWLQPCRQIRLIAYLIKTRFVWFAAHCVWDEMKILLISILSVGFYSVYGKQNICLQTIIVIVDCCFCNSTISFDDLAGVVGELLNTQRIRSFFKFRGERHVIGSRCSCF